LSKANRTYRIAVRAPALVVHMLHDSAEDRALARLFGEETGDEIDKFGQCRWEPGPDAVPVLSGCDWFAGRVVERADLGDHVGFVLDVRHGRATRTDVPYLGFQDVQDLDAAKPA
jgi:flavin reductase (DIM6/NTAB) family NADH-FMN oxidoreductase RutF